VAPYRWIVSESLSSAACLCPKPRGIAPCLVPTIRRMKPWICSPVKTPKAAWACATANYLTSTSLPQGPILLTMMRAQIALE
jgi:hypothetical protein